MANDTAVQSLRRAQALHAEGKIDEALGLAQTALAAEPSYVDALSYVGTTLVTRRLAFQDGLDILERALGLAPDDPAVHYSLGWCYEFVAYRLDKSSGRPYRDPGQLYALAAQRLRHCIELRPDEGLREDAEDLLRSIEDRFGPL